MLQDVSAVDFNGMTTHDIRYYFLRRLQSLQIPCNTLSASEALATVKQVQPSRLLRLARAVRVNGNDVERIYALDNELRYTHNLIARYLSRAPSLTQLEFLSEELAAVVHDFDDVFVSVDNAGANRCLYGEATTRTPILLEASVDGEQVVKSLGRMRIRLICVSDTNVAVNVRPLEPVYDLASNSSMGYFAHPNLTRFSPEDARVPDDLWRHNICLGEGNAAVLEAIRRWRWHDAFLLVDTILRTPSSNPYRPAVSWFGIPATCGHVTLHATRCRNANCQMTGCSRCLIKCDICRADVCMGCCQYILADDSGAARIMETLQAAGISVHLRDSFDLRICRSCFIRSCATSIREVLDHALLSPAFLDLRGTSYDLAAAYDDSFDDED